MPRSILLVAILLTVLTAPANVAGQNATTSQTADALYSAQKWTEAAVAYDQITKSEPQNARAWYRLGFALHSLGQFDKAVPAFEHAVAINQNPYLQPMVARRGTSITISSTYARRRRLRTEPLIRQR